MFDIPSIFLPDIIAGHARRHPAKPALICDDALLTWQELADAIDNFASFLLARGIGRGARIGVLAEPTSRAVVAELGALRAGAGVASLSGMASGEALARMIADAAPSLLVIDDHFSSLTASATAAGGPLLELAPTVKIGAALEGELAFEDAVASGRGRRAISFPRLEREDEFVILYSSGTTGEPKGIVLTHGCRLSHCMIIAMEQGYGPNAIVLGGTALYSNTTWSYVTLALFAGGTAVVMRKFDGREAVDLMARWRVTHALLVPAMLRMMLEAKGQDALDFTAVKAICTTGSSIPLPIKRQAIARFPGAYFEIYGLTEGFMLMLRPEEAEHHMESVGKPMLGHDIRIIDTADREMANGEKGEIVGYGPILMRGYHRRPEATAEAIWREPSSGRTFLRSGDVGYFDADGFLHLVDRRKDMLVSGAYNVYPADIERIIARHPAIREVAVIGVPHDKWGETPLAIVVWASDIARPDLEELKTWVNARVGKHERISAVRAIDVLPRNAGGKILKRELRERFSGSPAPSR